MNDRRREQLTSTIIAAVQEVIARGLSDPRLEGTMASITGATLSVDGRDITFRVSVLPEQAQSRAVAALKTAAKHIRHEAGEITDMRALPVFYFILDTSLKRQAAVLGTLGKVANEHPPVVEGDEVAAADAPSAETPPQPHGFPPRDQHPRPAAPEAKP